MGVIGKVRKVHRAFKFRVEVDGVGSASFQQCSGLEAEAEEIKLEEGGDPVGLKLPGKVSYSDITLIRGTSESRELYDLWKKTHDFVKGGGLVDEEIMFNMEIVQLDRDNAELRRWPVVMCWVKKFKAGEWNNTQNEAVMEEVTIVHHGFPDPV